MNRETMTFIIIDFKAPLPTTLLQSYLLSQHAVSCSWVLNIVCGYYQQGWMWLWVTRCITTLWMVFHNQRLYQAPSGSQLNISQPIRGQYPGHVITLSQSEASIQPQLSLCPTLTQNHQLQPLRKYQYNPHVFFISIIPMYFSLSAPDMSY